MDAVITILHVIVCIFLVAVVLLQRGKGAQVGAVFGGGAGATMFGSRGAGNFLTRLTTGSATIFMITSLFLAYSGADDGSDLLDEPPAVEESAAPFEEVGETGGFGEVGTVPAPDAPAPDATAPAIP